MGKDVKVYGVRLDWGNWREENIFVLYSSRCLRAGCGCSLSRDYEFLPVTAVMTAALGWFGTQKKCLARAAADKSLRVRYRVPAQGPKKTQRWRSSSLAAVSLRPARGVPYLGACELTVIVPALPPPCSFFLLLHRSFRNPQFES